MTAPGGSEAVAARLFGDYAPSATAYDEMFSAPGEVRPRWRELLGAVDELGRAELLRRWMQTQEEMHATGIAYNVFDESAGRSRPWELDLFPQLIDADEWARLSAGLQQRAALLNRILADLYGPQELLRSGALPAEWLFSHPGFQRVFHGQAPKDEVFLHFYAADLARTPNGEWWVVGDRTDAPLGIGFALENRILTARMLPQAISNFHVERLAPFFMVLQETLRKLAPAHRDNPRIVLLSQGPSGPNHFEDAYLARYLGYTLVEGGDLAVRDDHVFLKTLAGLLPVDVVLRRLSDAYSDPLELRSDAALGVPGLLQAARLGHVAVANALGSSLVESPALLPFLPGIARRWLGEELKLPSLATWWCGQEAARQEVAAIFASAPGRLAIRSAFRVGRRQASPEELRAGDALPDAVQSGAAGAADWIAQELVERSTSPVWCTGTTNRWRVAWRVYLVASGAGYTVMPGGLVRLAPESGALDASIFGGQMSQDAWVRSASPVQHVSLLATARQPIVLRRSGAELPSRVADHVFWLGRHLERAQSAARLLRPVVNRLTGEQQAAATPDLLCLIRCLAERGQIEPGYALDGMREKLPPIATVLPSYVLDVNFPGSLRGVMASAHGNAALVRDRLSLDIWRIVHQLERSLAVAADLAQAAGAPFGLVELDELLDESIISLAALDGLIAENMTRTPAWRFLDLGRRLERAAHVVSLVQSLPGESLREEGRVLEAALEVADTIMTYRGRYLAAFHRAAALDLLVTDETNPRSLAYQLAVLCDHVANLPRRESQPLGTPEERIASSLLHGLRMIDVEDLNAGGSERTKLGRLLQRIGDQLPKLSDVISHRYLIHAGRPQQMSARGGGV